MENPVDHFRADIVRRAIGLEIGGFAPPGEERTSWFGRVGFALPGETWPVSDGQPMHALCQINLTELPFRPPRLDDLEFITVFIGPGELPSDCPNGTGWCLRAYKALRDLVPLSQAETGATIKPHPMRPQVIDEDFPCWEDVSCPVPAEADANYYDLFPNVPGFKLGGWPSLIQSEIYWAPLQKHPAAPEYVFQIDTTEEGNWMWGDNGVGYFGRGTAEGHTDDWAFEWQCY